MSFESIFSNKQNVDPNLDALFKNKKPSNPTSDSIVKLIEKETEEPILNEHQRDFEDKQKTSRKKAAKVKQPRDEEQESRTIFVGNLPSNTKKEDLIKTFKAYGKIESVRFRNVVPADITKNKKYAFITKQTHENMNTINAFIRFETRENSEAALEVNGMEFKSHHLRVDLANQNKKHDNKRSVFLGGLPFDAKEETIYKTFSECGKIEAVRIIRDNKTGIGKGIGYVTFSEPGSVNLALKLNSVEVGDRKIRVERCSKKQKAKKTDTKETSKKVKKIKSLKTKDRNDKRPSKKRKQVSTNLKEVKRVRI